MATDTRGLLAGRYRKIGAIGVGGMARVFLAEDERLGRQVAIKQLHAESPAEAAARFEREAKLGASLNHPNLVSVYDIATDDESVLIVMEYVDGQTLKDAIAAGPLSLPRVVSIVHDVAAALGHAHGQGVVHRDVKPANILLRGDGMTKLADLGIATAAEGTSITRSGMVLGTASYMAPEQLDGQKVGPEADVYALAAVAFEAVSGRKALAGETPMEIAHRVISGPPPDLREAWPEAPEGAAEALRRGMARRPEDRPSSAGEFATALQRGLRGVSSVAATPPEAAAPPPSPPLTDDGLVEPPPPPPTERPPGAAGEGPRPTYRPRRQAPSWLTTAAAVAVLCVLAIVAFAVLGGGDDPQRGANPDRATRSDGGSDRPKSSAPQGGGKAADTSDGTSAPAAGSGSGSAGGTTSGTASAGGDPAALNSQGYRLMGQGRYREAIPLLQRAVAAYPGGSNEITYAYALYNLGKSLRLAGRPREAIPILEKRLRIPNQTETVRRELEAARRAAG